MAIDFVCVHCSKPYRVKDELAGKAAKCGKCGQRMQIPQFADQVAKAPAAAQSAAVSKPAVSNPVAGKVAPGAIAPAAPKPTTAPEAPAAAKPVAAKSAAAASANGNRPKQPPPQPRQALPAATHDTVANASASSDTGSWLDDELIAAPAAQSRPPAKDVACPKCGTRQPTGGMICGSCGEMLPMEAPASNRPVLLKPLAAKPTEAPKKKKRKRKLKLEMDAVAGLIKGTAFCIGFTFMGALLWAGVAVFLGFELRIIAVALGGLAGYGMALGHNDDNGLLAGIIAGFISFCGIIGAKILIVVFLVATLVAGGMDNLQREMVVQGIAQEIIEQQGGNPANVSLDQRERAVSTARAAVERMDDAQIEAKYNELEAKWENSTAAEPDEAAEPEVAEGGENESAPNEGEATAGDGDTAAEVQEAPVEQTPAPVAFDNAAMVEPEIEDSGSGSRGLFRIIDLLWILMAVGTAFKVGSGMGE